MFGWVLGASVDSARVPRRKLGDPGRNWRCASWSRAASLVREAVLRPKAARLAFIVVVFVLVCVFVVWVWVGFVVCFLWFCTR